METYRRYIIALALFLLGLLTVYAFGMIYYVVAYAVGGVTGAAITYRVRR